MARRIGIRLFPCGAKAGIVRIAQKLRRINIKFECVRSSINQRYSSTHLRFTIQNPSFKCGLRFQKLGTDFALRLKKNMGGFRMFAFLSITITAIILISIVSSIRDLVTPGSRRSFGQRALDINAKLSQLPLSEQSPTLQNTSRKLGLRSLVNDSGKLYVYVLSALAAMHAVAQTLADHGILLPWALDAAKLLKLFIEMLSGGMVSLL